ncbi:hypothetical protein IT568_06395 [bacterium]|nr:hypothetical protein [bacterium]
MKILLVDLGNVIIDVNFEKFINFVAEGSVRSTKEISQTLCAGEIKQKLDTGFLGANEFVNFSLDWLKNPKLDKNSFVFAWQNIFTLRKDANDFLQKTPLDWHLWLFSDTDPLHFTFALNNFEVLRKFENFIVSFVTGKLKTDETAFENLAKINKKNEILFVDDKLENVENARKSGIKSILFKSWSEVEI